MVTVAAALIVRDEEDFLPDCLSSLRGKVDEIVLVDTGSQDRTIAIAEQFGARIFHFDWIDDFAAARNRGLDEVRADWVLYIDADERLHTPQDRPLAELIAPEAIAAFVRFRPKIGYTCYRELRLFRRDDRLRFKGVIHETFTPAAERIVASGEAVLGRTLVRLEHLGYERDPRLKAGRNIPLLRRALAAEPQRVYCWYHLAESLAAIGQTDEGVAAGLRGLEAAQTSPSEKQRANASLIYQMLARIALERGRDPLALIAEGLAVLPDDFALQFLEGRARLAAGAHERALEIATRLRAIDPDDLLDGLLAFDRRIFTELADDLAGIACFRLGAFAEAARRFSAAAACAAEAEPYRMKARAAAMKAQPAALPARHSARA